MADSFAIGMPVRNLVAEKAAYAQQTRAGQRQKFPGWAVVGLFLPAADGQPTCIDYRVRAIPDTHDLLEQQRTLDVMADAMTQQNVELPAPIVTPGGIPRYVFEQASQVQLLRTARQTLKHSEYYRQNLDKEVRGWLASDSRKKPGRPPARGLPEKLRILQDVENAIEAGGASMDDVAAKWHISRSGLRDLLSWARHKASPVLFTDSGPGKRGGGLTPDARALLDEIEGTV